MWNQDLYQKTILFAAAAHKNQKVPGTDLSYLVHLSNVCMEVLAALVNSSDKVDGDLCMQGALLHDTIEDTEVKVDEIEQHFGKQVLTVVQALTKDKTLPKLEQMQGSLQRIKIAGKEAAMVKMADRIVNLQPPPSYWNKEKIKTYKIEAQLIYENLNAYHDYLSNRLKQKIEAYEKFT